jgi:hypothetical protein
VGTKGVFLFERDIFGFDAGTNPVEKGSIESGQRPVSEEEGAIPGRDRAIRRAGARETGHRTNERAFQRSTKNGHT